MSNLSDDLAESGAALEQIRVDLKQLRADALAQRSAILKHLSALSAERLRQEEIQTELDQIRHDSIVISQSISILRFDIDSHIKE